MSEITPDIVREYKSFTPKFLCSLDANIYNIQFRRFRIRDMESDFVLFDVGDDSDGSNQEELDEEKKKAELEDEIDEYINEIPVQAAAYVEALTIECAEIELRIEVLTKIATEYEEILKEALGYSESPAA